MRVIIVDDEPLALEVLEHALAAFKDVEIVGRYIKPMLAIKDIEDLKPDAVFLDIEMGAINGLELGELLQNRYGGLEMVFITAYSQYAIDAFEINAIDYLVKPVNKDRLTKTVKRLREKLNDSVKTKREAASAELIIKSFGGFDVYDSKGEIIRWRTKKAKELFAFIWHKDSRTVNRDSIINEIFYDKGQDQATALLHTTIYQLRNSLKELGFPKGIVYENEGYRLNVAHTSDLEELSRILSNAELSEKQVSDLMAIYQGDFLKEGYTWAREIQQSYRSVILEALKSYASRQIEKREYREELRSVLAKIYEMDSFDDESADLILKYYGENGKIQELDAFYKSHIDNLKEEMGLEPSRRIRTIYEKYKSM